MWKTVKTPEVRLGLDLHRQGVAAGATHLRLRRRRGHGDLDDSVFTDGTSHAVVRGLSPPG